ncbi:MAG: dihydroneopterin aldolase [Spirochaetota bacterium]
MKATVGFEELQVRAVIGALATERTAGQPLRLSIFLDYDAAAPIASDSIDDAVDYAAVASVVEKVAEEGRFHLMETLCGAIIGAVREEFPQVTGVVVEARKPRAIAGAKAAFTKIAWSAETPKVAPERVDMGRG